jgi:hypothetical protein
VIADGPGAVGGLPVTPTCLDDCTETVAVGASITLHADAFESHDGFVGWGGCPGLVAGPDCTFSVAGDVEVDAHFDPVVSYAPWMRFHPDETHWPMDPNDFVENSALKWANIRTPSVVPCTKKDVGIKGAGTGKVDALKLGAGGYSYAYCWQVIGVDIGPKQTATFDTADFTSPSRPDVTPDPAGKSGFYLDLSDSVRCGVVPLPPAKKCKNTRRDGSDPSYSEYTNAPPLYVEYKPNDYVIYWFFFGQNYRDTPHPFKDIHEGDWEHIVVFLDAGNRASEVGYWQHYCPGELHDYNDLDIDGKLHGDLVNPIKTHPPVWVAEGSHASYPEDVSLAGILPCGNPLNGVLDYTAPGLVWRTWQNGSDGFRRADAQPWYGFGGGWGSKGTGDFWGPLGPGPLKLDDALRTG